MKTIKTTILMAILSLLNLSIANAGSSDGEVKNAEITLIQYLDAGDKSNTSQLENLMHTNYRVIFKDTKKDEISEITRESYLDFIAKKIFGGTTRTIKTIKGSVLGGEVANFEVVTISKSGTMTSYYSLVKEKGKWLVVQDLVYM